MSKRNPVTGGIFYDKNIWNSLPQKHQIYWTDSDQHIWKLGHLDGFGIWLQEFNLKNLLLGQLFCTYHRCNQLYFFFILPQYIPNNFGF